MCAGADRYEVFADIDIETFAKFTDIRESFSEKLFVDLKAIARAQLLALGLKKEHMEISDECTYDNEGKYFSWRRDTPPVKETMIAVIGLR